MLSIINVFFSKIKEAQKDYSCKRGIYDVLKQLVEKSS